MGSHAYCRFILKTPKGYLTENGATEDIGAEEVLVLNIYGVGGWSSTPGRDVQKFLKHSTADFKPEDCKLMLYCCPLDNCSYSCDACRIKGVCKFWTNRKECKFT